MVGQITVGGQHLAWKEVVRGAGRGIVFGCVLGSVGGDTERSNRCPAHSRQVWGDSYVVWRCHCGF